MERVRFEEWVQARVPAVLRTELEAEARRQMTTASEVLRQCLIEALGVIPSSGADGNDGQGGGDHEK